MACLALRNNKLLFLEQMREMTTKPHNTRDVNDAFTHAHKPKFFVFFFLNLICNSFILNRNFDFWKYCYQIKSNLTNCDLLPSPYSYILSLKSCYVQAPVVQRADNSIQRINHYQVDSVICFVIIHSLDSDLSGGQRYPRFDNRALFFRIFLSTFGGIWQYGKETRHAKFDISAGCCPIKQTYGSGINVIYVVHL